MDNKDIIRLLIEEEIKQSFAEEETFTVPGGARDEHTIEYADALTAVWEHMFDPNKTPGGLTSWQAQVQSAVDDIEAQLHDLVDNVELQLLKGEYATPSLSDESKDEE